MPEQSAEESDRSFPRLQSSKPATVTRPYELRTWSGSKERLIAIQEAVQDALEQAYEAATADLPNPDVTDPGRAVPARFEFERVRDAFRLEVVVVGDQGRWVQKGELSSIFSTVEIDEISKVRMGNRSYRESVPTIEIEFSNSAGLISPAVEMTVSGTDRTWVTGVHDTLQSMISKGRPSWHLLRSWWAPTAVAMLMFIGVSLATVMAFGGFVEDPAEARINTGVELFNFGAYMTGFAILANLGCRRAFKRALPAFEVIAPGERGLGSRNVAILGTVALTLLTSIVVPIVLYFTLGI